MPLQNLITSAPFLTEEQKHYYSSLILQMDEEQRETLSAFMQSASAQYEQDKEVIDRSIAEEVMHVEGKVQTAYHEIQKKLESISQDSDTQQRNHLLTTL